jgi:hypothetical protein
VSQHYGPSRPFTGVTLLFIHWFSIGNRIYWTLQLVITSKDYALTVLYTSQIAIRQTKSFQCLTFFTSHCLVAAYSGGLAPCSGFLNCPRPQLPASHSNSSQLNRSSSLTHSPSDFNKIMLRPTVCRSAGLCVQHLSGAQDQIFNILRHLLVFWCGEDERTGPLFTITARPRQRSHSRVRVPRDSWPYFTVSDSKLPNLKGEIPVFTFPRNRVDWSMSRSSDCNRSKLLYDWPLISNQFVLAPSPLRHTTRDSFCNWTLAVMVLRKHPLRWDNKRSSL